MMAAGSVLLLEDDPMIRDLVEAVLEDEGHEVVICSSLDHLMGAAAESPDALALSDFWGDSHQELSDDERAQVVQLARTVPTVLVTARTWANTVAAADLGLVAVVPKPFDVDHLADLVASSLTQIHAGGAAL